MCVCERERGSECENACVFVTNVLDNEGEKLQQCPAETWGQAEIKPGHSRYPQLPRVPMTTTSTPGPHLKTVKQHPPQSSTTTNWGRCIGQTATAALQPSGRPPVTCSPGDHYHPPPIQIGKRDYSRSPPLSNGIDQWEPERDKFIQLVFWRGRHFLQTNVVKN